MPEKFIGKVEICKSNSILEINFPPKKERPEKPERVKKERPERKVNPAATETATLEKEEGVDVVDMVKKVNEDKASDQNSEDKAIG